MPITPPTLTSADVIINVVELNQRHGVGILLNRIFGDSPQNIIVLRTLNIYGGDSRLGKLDFVLGEIGLSREVVGVKVAKFLNGHKVKRILCVPYHQEEILMALAVQDITGAPICTYLMDDQNLLHHGISLELMQELLDRSALRLGISHAMCAFYCLKYQVPIYFAPPIISAELLDTSIPKLPERSLELQRGVIVGNIWSPKWLKLLRHLTQTTKIELDWYGNSGAEWYIKDRANLERDGIIERGFLPTEAEVATIIRSYAYVIVTTGTLDSTDGNNATAWLSLPSRILFILASSNTPIVVLGHPQTTAAQFVEQFGIGVVAEYTPESMKKAIDRVTQPEIQQQMRENAARLAPQFVNHHMEQWIWASLAAGRPIDDRFEQLLPAQTDYLAALNICFSLIHHQQVEINQLQEQKFSLEKYIKRSKDFLKSIARVIRLGYKSSK